MPRTRRSGLRQIRPLMSYREVMGALLQPVQVGRCARPARPPRGAAQTAAGHVTARHLVQEPEPQWAGGVLDWRHRRRLGDPVVRPCCPRLPGEQVDGPGRLAEQPWVTVEVRMRDRKGGIGFGDLLGPPMNAAQPSRAGAGAASSKTTVFCASKRSRKNTRRTSSGRQSKPSQRSHQPRV
jgi:hypothetical protein